MTLTYHSTRNKDLKVTASQAILAGIAPDGGLFVPSFIPKLNIPLADLPNNSYEELAFAVLQSFLTDFTDEELKECIQVYSDKFSVAAVTPLIEAGNAHYLELFHGPTIAFKDVALSILPKFMTIAAKKNQNENDIVILTATSGDTGKAALVGFQDVPGTKIIVFYPKNGVSEFQERQMLTQKGKNVSVVAIEGNFDDAQSQVKALFADNELRTDLANNNLQLSSANSINIGRLIPQIIYYIDAYKQLLADNKLTVGEKMNVCVPTGNFGNILAAYYAKEMGLPIAKLIVASNENSVLTDFFKSGTYNRNRDFILTTSPSMDILVSSNLERLLYHLSGENDQLVEAYMNDLSVKGQYRITSKMLQEAEAFVAGSATQADVISEIKNVHAETQYTIDPHTAVASFVAKKFQDDLPMVVASTASPYKFPEAVLEALTPDFKRSDLVSALEEVRAITATPFPAAIEEALCGETLHNTVVPVSEMKQAVKNILHI